MTVQGSEQWDEKLILLRHVVVDGGMTQKL